MAAMFAIRREYALPRSAPNCRIRMKKVELRRRGGEQGVVLLLDFPIQVAHCGQITRGLATLANALILAFSWAVHQIKTRSMDGRPRSGTATILSSRRVKAFPAAVG